MKPANIFVESSTLLSWLYFYVLQILLVVMKSCSILVSKSTKYPQLHAYNLLNLTSCTLCFSSFTVIHVDWPNKQCMGVKASRTVKNVKVL